MNIQQIREYAVVKDNNKPAYVFLAVIIATIIICFVFVSDPASYSSLLFLSLFLLFPLFNMFRSRTCATCNTSMKRFYAMALPKYHYCETCKTRIHVGMIPVGASGG